MLFDLLIRPWIARALGPQCAYGALAIEAVSITINEELQREYDQVVRALDTRRDLRELSAAAA